MARGHGDEPFFRVTKLIHNGLQGDPHGLTEEDQSEYLATSETWEFLGGFCVTTTPEAVRVSHPSRARSVGAAARPPV